MNEPDELLNKADVLLAEAGADPDNIAFQQSVITQAADLAREATNLLRRDASLAKADAVQAP